MQKEQSPKADVVTKSLAFLATTLTGVAGWITATDHSSAGGGTGLIASAIAFGLLTNALYRR